MHDICKKESGPLAQTFSDLIVATWDEIMLGQEKRDPKEVEKLSSEAMWEIRQGCHTLAMKMSSVARKRDERGTNRQSCFNVSTQSRL